MAVVHDFPADGTYTFSDKNCSPRGMLVPQRPDLSGVMITNWWADRYVRYNKYLGGYGLVLGVICVVVDEMMCFSSTPTVSGSRTG